MKLINAFILNLILISNIISLDYLGDDDILKIYPRMSYGFIYLKLRSFNSEKNVYLSLKYNPSGNIDSSIKIQYINDVNENVNAKSWENIDSYETFESPEDNGYYFEIENSEQINYIYVIVLYSGYKVCEKCYLKITTVKPYVKTGLIIFAIIISCISGPALIFLVVYKILKCIKKRRQNNPESQKINSHLLVTPNNDNDPNSNPVSNNDTPNPPDVNCSSDINNPPINDETPIDNDTPIDSDTPNYKSGDDNNSEYYGPTPNDNLNIN